MSQKLEDLKAFIHKKADQTSQVVTAFSEHENTKAVAAWSKDKANIAADEAVKLGKRVGNSEMGKDAATGAAIGAVVAVPIPIIGPIFGAVVGAAAGVFMNLKSDGSKKTATHYEKEKPGTPDIDIHKRLMELDDLRQKGILSQEEFNLEKKKLLNR